MSTVKSNQQRVVDRLNRIEGQVRGVRRMVEEQRPCIEIMKQVAAVNGALRSLTNFMLEHHLQVCVTDAIEGRVRREDLIAQLVDVFERVSA